MADELTSAGHGVRYEPDENPPALLSAGLGIQLAVLSISGIVLTPAIVIGVAGGSETYMNWAVFAAVAVCGITTLVQAIKLGRIGSGYVLLMGTSGAFIAVCVAAISAGGPGLLATLVVVSSLFQFALAYRLSWFRKILTPTVAGTVLMLIAVTVMPILFDALKPVPGATEPAAVPLSAIVTFLIIVGIALKAKGILRLWAPVIGVILGSIFSAFVGLYDFGRVATAPWIGFPTVGWPGLDLEFGTLFWALLPAFIFVTLIGAIETIGDSVAIQRVSWRKPRAMDYRTVQGALNADGLGNLLSGLAGTMPNTTYSSSVAVTELTGVASRKVGIAIGIVFLVFALCPKVIALVLAIPDAVAAAYISVLIAMLFMIGMRIVVNAGGGYRNGLIVALSFWIGVGFQNGVIFPEYFSGLIGSLLQNGMTAGGLVAIALTLFVELTDIRRTRLKIDLDEHALTKMRDFLSSFSKKEGWDSRFSDRLYAVGEETLHTLSHKESVQSEGTDRKLNVVARKEENGAVLEFIASSGDDNIQDRIAMLGEQAVGTPIESEISLRLLRHLASSVHHRQYHDLDIITVQVDARDL